MKGPSPWRVLGGLVLVLAGALVVGASAGSADVGLRDLAALLAGAGDETARRILLDVRLPRVVLGALVGLALASAGVAFQAVLRNPLADPFILGVSGGAALGAVVFAVAAPAGWLLAAAGRPAAAFAGSLSTLGVLALARSRGRTDPTSLLLIGVVVNAFHSAMMLFLISLAGSRELLQAQHFLIGGIPEGLDAVTLGVLGGVLVACAVFLQRHALAMNLLALGDESAASLGVPVERTLWRLVVAASVATAAGVAWTGLIGFVGLMVPHAARRVIGPDHRLLLPASALAGASFLVLADAAARTVLAPVELPVGVITALTGAPFFLWLFVRRGRDDAP